ncbi:MAG: AI-2E family transporter, partial [Lachnospiraceae bacterium]|nr:AI-2E family transporter [Lachnospiraceae bacterium]
ILHAYFPQKVYDRTLEIASLAGKNFSSFITGQCMEAVILGVMFVVSMTLFGFPYAVMVGVLIAFTALIPIVGAFIGCFVGAFLIMVDDPVKAIWFLLLFIVLQQIEGNLIYPHVVGNSVGLPSIWVLAAVTVGGSLMGVVGMLIFIPILSTVYALIREDVNEKNKRSRKS